MSETENKLVDFDVKKQSVELKIADKRAQDLLWQFAMRYKGIDGVFSAEVRQALLHAGFLPTPPRADGLQKLLEDIAFLPDGAMGSVSSPVPPYQQDLIPFAINGLQKFIERFKAAIASGEVPHDR